MSHIEISHHGIVAATVCDAPILKLALLGSTDGKNKIIVDAEQLRWIVQEAGPALLASWNG
jgi:hypothetical protein